MLNVFTHRCFFSLLNAYICISCSSSTKSEVITRRPSGGKGTSALQYLGSSPQSGSSALPAENSLGQTHIPMENECAANSWSSGGTPVLRKLSNFEYDNTVFDLLGDSSHPSQNFPLDEKHRYFDNPSENKVSQLLKEAQLAAAETLAANAVKNISTLAVCETGKDETACATQFVKNFGKRAFRRPLSISEQNRYVSLFALQKNSGTYSDGIRIVIETFLQSPYFLYRTELGGDPDNLGLVHLTPYEIASELSYYIWASQPDDILMQAGDEGKLLTTDGIAFQVERMLASEKAKQGVGHFFQNWLKFDRLDSATKDPILFPLFNTDLKSAMKAETQAFVDSIVWGSDQSKNFETFFNANYSFVNSKLASVYGVKGIANEQFTRVDLDPTQRAGLLTQASFLASNAFTFESSPIFRGKFVRSQFLCQDVPPPPPNVPFLDAATVTLKSNRDRLLEHSKSAACSGCHSLMDPIGFGLENYDGIGSFRSMQRTFPIDVSGEIKQTSMTNGKFNGALELSKILAKSEDVKRCFVIQWYRYAFGRQEVSGDACAMQGSFQSFSAANFNVKSLISSLAQSDDIRVRKKDPTK